MCTGIALVQSELPKPLFERHALDRRAHHGRGGEDEVWFLYRHFDRCLPVWYEGELVVLPWGCRRSDSRALPCTGWTWKDTLEAGGWANVEFTEAVIPANYGLEKGVWFTITQGIRAIVVKDEKGQPRVYMVCEPASRYYRVMTKSDRMPALVEQTI
ncbi:MAG: hypothetical protein ACJ786_32520 [Catenulispora sp.]